MWAEQAIFLHHKEEPRPLGEEEEQMTPSAFGDSHISFHSFFFEPGQVEESASG